MLDNFVAIQWLNQEWVDYCLLPGLAAAMCSAGAGYKYQTQLARRNPDVVGIVPWRDVAFILAMVAVVFLAMAVIGWVRSS